MTEQRDENSRKIWPIGEKMAVQMNDLELAVRTIENILPDMPTKSLQKWHGILNTALIKVEQELNSTMMHQCTACGFEEYGYRTELLIFWRAKGDTIICWNHEEKEVDSWLQKPPEIEVAKPEDTLEELLAEL